MRKARIILTGLVFILCWAGPLLSVVSFDLQKFFIRKRMKTELVSQPVLQTVTVPAEQVIWMDDHEIWVHEHMFDIHTSSLNNGIYTFTGLFDEEETRLVLKEKSEHEKQKKEGQLAQRLIKFLQYFAAFPDYQVTSHHTLLTRFRYHTVSPLSDLIQPIITPPPDRLPSIS